MASETKEPESDQKRWYVLFRKEELGKGPSLPEPPPWRRPPGLKAEESGATRTTIKNRGTGYIVGEEEAEMVNAALYLRRPLLLTGKPGTGKSTLAYAAAHQLGLEKPLVWPITTRTTLQQGLYRYDAIGRLQAAALQNKLWERRQEKDKNAENIDKDVTEDASIADYLQLGPLGTALASRITKEPRLRVLLIDEIDKSDIDLPNDLLNVLEEGEFVIDELRRLGRDLTLPIPPDDEGELIPITGGQVRCERFPLVIITSNGERDFPPAFLRRCLRLQIPEPTLPRLEEIVASRLELDPALPSAVSKLIEDFYKRRQSGQELSTDQLLNAVYLVLRQTSLEDLDRTTFETVLGDRLLDSVLAPLTAGSLAPD